MSAITSSNQLLALEAKGLLARLGKIKSLALLDASVPAAQISVPAQIAIETHLVAGRKLLHREIRAYIDWLNLDSKYSPATAQRRYTMLRLRFNAVLSKFDIFADVVTQRSEHETGIWLSGLDAFATDAMTLQGYFTPPPVICYLERGAGAAIRRVRTRLPGGGRNPAAVIRIPRERMIGSGIASSLVHEAGHQVAAGLDLVNTLSYAIQQKSALEPEHSHWQFWNRWISEIIADFWSVAKIGVGSTLGLMGVVSLPRAFVFRVSMDDPHPIPWIRVKLSCAIGQALYPHPQWTRLANLWESLYPTDALDIEKRELLARLELGMPDFVRLLVGHRPKVLRGNSLIEIIHMENRMPSRLAAYYQRWQSDSKEIYRAAPSLVFAVIGQAKLDGLIDATKESDIVAKLLTHWALQSTLNASMMQTAVGTNRLAVATS